MLAQRHGDVFGHGQRAEQGAMLKQHAAAAAQHATSASFIVLGRSDRRFQSSPAVGCCSKIISRISTDLPLPLPPAMANTSSLVDRQADIVMHDGAPKRVWIWLTSISGSGLSAR